MTFRIQEGMRSTGGPICYIAVRHVYQGADAQSLHYKALQNGDETCWITTLDSGVMHSVITIDILR